MSLGIFKLDIDKSTEETLKNFIYSNTLREGGYNVYKLDKDNKKKSCVEKAIYKLAEHNVNYMKNGNIEDFNVTFFTKRYKVTDDDLNIHTDIDDIDVIKNQTQTIAPVLSSITYLSKTTNPTMITNITGNDMYDLDNVNIVDTDKDVCSLLYYPDKYDHIIFEGAKYYHGEIPMYSNVSPFTNDCIDFVSGKCECEERLMIVIFVWKKEDLPIVPYYKSDIASYNIISRCRDIENTNDFINDIIDDRKEVLSNESKDYKLEIHTKTVNIINYVDKLLTHKFYVDTYRKIHDRITIQNFNKICDYNIVNKITNVRNEISLQELNFVFFLSEKNVEINDIFDLKTHYVNDHFLDYKIFEEGSHNYTLDVIWKNKSMYDLYPIYKTHKVELQIDDKLLEKNIEYYVMHKHITYKEEGFMLDVRQKYFSPLEKLVYDIAESTLNNINIPFDNNIKIEFWIKTSNDDPNITFHLDSSDSKNDIGYNICPFISNIYYLNDDSDNNYTVVTSLNMRDLKYHNTKNNKDICFIMPKKNKLLTIFGGNHYHGNIKSSSKKRQLLILNYWYKPYLNIRNYYKNTYNVETYEKNKCKTKFNISRTYRTINIDDELMGVFVRKLLETNDKYENYVDLINKIDDTYDATLFVSNASTKPLESLKFVLGNNSYIEDEFNRLNNEVIKKCKTDGVLNNVMKPSENIIIKKSSVVHKEKFDIYNYHISFNILHITEAYIRSLESKFNRIHDDIDCLELDYREQLDENMQRFIFKELLLSVLDYIKKGKLNIQRMKIRKNITYNGYTNNNHIYIPLSDKIRLLLDSHVIDVFKGGFIDINSKTHICIDNEEILLICLEYI